VPSLHLSGRSRARRASQEADTIRAHACENDAILTYQQRAQALQEKVKKMTSFSFRVTEELAQSHRYANSLRNLKVAHAEANYPFDGEVSGEDALDQATVRFEDIEAELAYDYYLGVERADDLDDTRNERDWNLFTKCVVNAPAGKLQEGSNRYHDIVHAWDD